MKPGSALLAVNYGSIGEGYEALQKVGKDHDVIEMIPSAAGSTLLIAGEAGALENLLRELPPPESSRLIAAVGEPVARAWLGLENPPLRSVLAVYESSAVGEVFEAAVRFEKQGYVPFDLRVLRGAQAKAYVLATGDGGEVPSVADLRGQLTLIGRPSDALRSFFELQP